MTQDARPGEATTAPRVFSSRISYWTLGCRLNQHDTAAMRSTLSEKGWREAGPDDEPDVVVINTCTVTARADQEARQLIRRLARRHPGARLVITGCYAQRAPGEVAAIPGVDLVLGTAERDRIAEVLGPPARAWEGISFTPSVAVGPARARRPMAPTAPLSFGRTRALLKVQDGCDAFCSYCVVPYVRGRSRSLPLREALDQGRRLLDAGFHELVVTGADLGSYGLDRGARGLLPALVEGLLSLGETHRVRLSSIEPNKVDPALVALIGAEPRLCRHLHVPLQSGSHAVLRSMRRRYTPEDYGCLIERIAGRGLVAIGADVIVGFPGEREEDFEATFRLIERLPLSYLHVFRYSPRPGTRAMEKTGTEELPSATDRGAARERSERLRALGESKRGSFYRGLIGATLPGLVEGGGTAEVLTAMTDLYAPVRLKRRPRTSGIVPIRVESIHDGILAGSTGG